MSSYGTAGNGPIRGMHSAWGRLFVVSGSELYRVRSDGQIALIGSGISGSAPVSIDHNADSLVVVANPNAYYWLKSADTSGDAVPTPTLTAITDPDFTSRGAKYVRFVDNYMLFMEPNSGRFFGSDVGSVTNYNALNFATAEAAPDDLVGMIVDHRQVLLLGEESGEVWENTGAAGFPFERAVNGFFEIGCANGDTVAKLDQSVAWVANDYTVRRLTGLTPQKISTVAVEQFLSTATLSTGKAYAYSLDGHFFYVMSFTEGCWTYDATTNEWSERGSYPETYYKWQFSATAFGNVFVGDAYSNKIGTLKISTYDEVGSVQRMEVAFQPVYAENRRAIHHELEIVMETGVGLTTGQGSDPEAMLDYSDDGGITWKSLPNKRLGALGERRTRVVWNKLGSARQRVYRIAVSDPVKVVLTDAVLDVTGGRF